MVIGSSPYSGPKHHHLSPETLKYLLVPLPPALASLLSLLGKAARGILIKHKSDHFTPVSKTLLCSSTAKGPAVAYNAAFGPKRVLQFWAAHELWPLPLSTLKHYRKQEVYNGTRKKIK